MKRLLITLILVFWYSTSEATNYGGEYILFPHLNFSYFSNYCRRSDMSMLYYTGLFEAVDAHIDRRIQEGALPAKKFEIRFSDPYADMPAAVVDVSQNRRSYHVTSRDFGDLNLPYFVRVVDYFASKNWKPFACCGRYVEVSTEDVRKRFGRILDREAGAPDMSFFDGRSSVVFESGDLQVVYESDRLFFVLAGKKLDLEPGDPIPVKVGPRYLFGSKDFLHVYENGAEVQRRSKSASKEWSCTEPTFMAKGYRKWINIGCDGGVYLSYSYDKNQFYEIARAQENFDRPRCSDMRGKGEVHPPPLRVVKNSG